MNCVQSSVICGIILHLFRASSPVHVASPLEYITESKGHLGDCFSIAVADACQAVIEI